MGAAADAVGRPVLLDGKPYQIVGILPAGFQSPPKLGVDTPTEVYLTASYPREQLANRGDHDVNVVARLKRGVSFSPWRAAVLHAPALISAPSKPLSCTQPHRGRRVRAGLRLAKS